MKDDTVAIDGYFDKTRHGDGVALHIRETLDFELRDDIPKRSMESICIKVKPKCIKSFFVSMRHTDYNRDGDFTQRPW